MRQQMVKVEEGRAMVFRGDRWIVVTDRLKLTVLEKQRLAGHEYEVVKTIA